MKVYLRRSGVQYEYEYSSYEYNEDRLKNIRGYIKKNNEYFDTNHITIKEENVIDLIRCDIENGYEFIYIRDIDNAINRLCEDYYNLLKFIKVLGLNLEIYRKREYLYKFEIKDNKNGRIINKKEIYYLETEREELIGRIKEIFEKSREKDGLYFMETDGDIEQNIRLRTLRKSNGEIEQYIEVILNDLKELNIKIDCLMEEVEFEDLNKENEILFL